MKAGKHRKRYWIGGALLLALVPVLYFRHEIGAGLMVAYGWISDREQVEHFVTVFGKGAPLAFMAIQILQVVIAPVPGEVTGFIGGYIFGWGKGFLYSSLALAVGSWINFAIGRYLGSRFVRGWIPDEKLARFDHLVKRQGIIVLSILFVFPGFPKDYLCLFLGITAIPLEAFLFIASIGRMPGTLMLSVQGHFLFERNYAVFAIVLMVTLLVAYLCIRYRDQIYRLVEKLNGKPPGSR